MGYGQLMEVYKDMGLPVDVAERYGLGAMEGTHAIGHTRMATESAVTTEHSHPFTAASDMCLVHNGSLSNHNNLRKWLRRRGQSSRPTTTAKSPRAISPTALAKARHWPRRWKRA